MHIAGTPRSCSSTRAEPASSSALAAPLQVFQVLSSVNARLEQAAAAHPSRLQGSMSGPGCSPGTPAGTPTGSSWASGSVKRDTLVALLQQLTDGVVGLIEGLSVEKECLESQMLQANEEAQQLRRQVCMARAACGPGSVSAMGCSCACARSCLAASADFT